MNFKDFLSFEKFLSGNILKFLYWLGLVIIVMFVLASMSGSISTMSYNGALGLLQLVVAMAVGALGPAPRRGPDGSPTRKARDRLRRFAGRDGTGLALAHHDGAGGDFFGAHHGERRQRVADGAEIGADDEERREAGLFIQRLHPAEH